ncbi:putative glycoside hydrolase family 114 protein [Lyophyllum shimeji]|uniref:alpha-galactosidase n=1 Tax=Lyophyllum shimeji TaxID=47721 RepID=A0A9P3UUT2_LYOSH|nr:putative glycoside hydrolase family 114 protein [Lyophyllum shimeji]
MQFRALLALCVAATTASATILPRSVTPPPVNGKFDYQIGGSYTPASDVTIVSRDNAENPAAGKYNICYLNAFQTQPEAQSWWKTNHPDLLLKKSDGSYFQDQDWPGEFFLDTTTDAKRQALLAIHQTTIDSCASKGFNAIEPDNLDTFTRSNGLLTKADNLAFAKLLADYAHGKGLAFGQKNTGSDLGSSGKTTVGFDFAIAEECGYYNECDSYTNVYGNNVIEIEYSDNGKSAYTAACSARGAQISIIYRDRDVVPNGDSAYVYQAC